MSPVNVRGERRRALMQAALARQPMTSYDLSTQLCLTHRYTNHCLQLLYDAGEIHIAGWERGSNGRALLARYAWGAGDDAPKPAKKPVRSATPVAAARPPAGDALDILTLWHHR